MAENRLKSRREKKGVKMRLNRVLQNKSHRAFLLAAAVGIAMAATVFTISCGEDGSDGKEGASCSISGSGVPYTVTCSGVEVGLLDGVNGEPGLPGSTGETGSKGASCSLSPSGNSYTITCGGDIQGTLGGCGINTKDRETTIDCGPSKIRLCDNQVFDPSEYYCSESGVALVVGYCGGDGTSDAIDAIAYNPSKYYCGFKTEALFEAGKPDTIPICEGAGVSPHHNEPNEAIYDDTDGKWVLSYDNDVPALAIDWKDEFCQVSRDGEVNSLNGVFVPNEDKKTAEPSECNGIKVKTNENTWKGEYCGYKDNKAASKSVVNTACGNGDEPNAVAFEKEYCTISSSISQLTEATDRFCGKVKLGERAAVKGKINPSTEKGILPSGAFKGEYCGYTRANWNKTIAGRIDTTSGGFQTGAKAHDTLYLDVIKSGICGDGKGPNDSSSYDFRTNNTPGWVTSQPKWLNQFCQGQDRLNPTKTVVAPTAAILDGSLDVYCMKNVAVEFSNKGVANQRLNEGGWKGEGCIFAKPTDYPGSATSTDASYFGAPTVAKSGRCGDGLMPNDANLSRYNPGGAYFVSSPTYSSTVQPFWHNEYCQYSESEGNTVRVGIVLTTVSGVSRDADMFEKYCVTDTVLVGDTDPIKNASYLDKLQKADATKMLDKDAAKSTQYCGFKTRNDLHNLTALSNPKATFTRLEKCTNGDMPNAANDITAAMTVGNPTTSTEITSKAWFKNEFCQYDKDAGGSGIPGTKKVGIVLTVSGSVLRDVNILTKYCPSDTTFTKVGGTQGSVADGDYGNENYITKFQTIVSASSNNLRLNEKASNNNQYCGFESKSKMDNEVKIPTLLTTEVPGVVSGNVKRPSFKVLTGRCTNPDDNVGPNQARAGYTSWANEYCQVKNRLDGFTTRVGSSSSDVYCISSEASYDYTSATANAGRLNEGSWKGQYCFDDEKVGVCTGGYVPISGAASTDNPKCELP
jgi:hypothetical protein